MGPDRLAHQHVALAAVQPAVEVGRGQPPQLELMRDVARQVTHGPAEPADHRPVNGLHRAPEPQLEARALLDPRVVLEALQPQAQQVVHPHRDAGRIDLGALGLEPAVDIVVGVPLDGLEIELAGDLHGGLHAEPIDLDGVELPPHLAHGLREIAGGEEPEHRPVRPALRPVPEHLVQELDRFLDHHLGLAGNHFVGPHLVLEVLDEVGAEDRPQAAQRDRQVEIEAVAHRRLLVELVLGEEEHAEGVEPGIAQGQLVALVILAEATGPAGAGGQIDELLVHVLGAGRLGLLLEEVDQVAGGEAGRAALADVGDLAPGEEIVLGGHRQDLRLVAAALQHRLEDPLDAPVQAAEEDRHRIALGAGEGARGIGAVVAGPRSLVSGPFSGCRGHCVLLYRGGITCRLCRSIQDSRSCTVSKPGRRRIVSSTLRAAARPSDPPNR